MLLQSALRAPAKPYEFFCYLTAEGRNDLDKWDAQLSIRGRANRNVTMRHLASQPRERWVRPNASALKNDVCVIRFIDENRTQHRMCGFFDTEHHAFVICVTMVEKNGKYNPLDYEKRTLRAKNQVHGIFEQRTIKCAWASR